MDVLRVLDFEGEQQADGLQRVRPAVDIVSEEQVIDVGDVARRRGVAVLFKQAHEVSKLPVQVPKDLHGGLEREHAGLLPENGLRLVAQLADLLGVEDERAVVARLPCPWLEQLLQHDPVDARGQRGLLPLKDGRRLALPVRAHADPPALVLKLVYRELAHQAPQRPRALLGNHNGAVMQADVWGRWCRGGAGFCHHWVLDCDARRAVCRMG
mmetsp:Transcript_42981/g.102033  ORF Transcript_42981/g.102033 Transcript_42981/m.102033 type:complete len:212 (-) Transcript_42981:215-850(-)